MATSSRKLSIADWVKQHFPAEPAVLDSVDAPQLVIGEVTWTVGQRVRLNYDAQRRIGTIELLRTSGWAVIRLSDGERHEGFLLGGIESAGKGMW